MERCPNPTGRESPASIRAGRPGAARPAISPRAAVLGALAALVYLSVAGGGRWRFAQSPYPYHVLTADALLHGQLHLRSEVLGAQFQRAERAARELISSQLRVMGLSLPEREFEEYVRLRVIHDLAQVGDRFYTYWGPLTAVMLIPWVAAFGPGVSDDLVNALFGAVNVALAYWMFRRVDRAGLRRMSEPCCVALTLLLAFGTVHFYLSCSGRVWFSVQIATLTFVLLSVIAAAGRSAAPWTFALSGALFGAAVLGRNIVAALGLFFPAVIWARRREYAGGGLRPCLLRAVAFVLPVTAAGLAQLAYNYGRFGSILETGQAVTIRTGGEPRFREEYERYGSFHPAYLVRNVRYYLWNWRFPVVHGQRTFDPEGNSMFLITPPLLFCFAAWRRRDAFTVALLCGVVPLITALLLFRATGFRQFGNRYLLDAMPLLLLLVATGMNGRLSFPGLVLIILAIAMNTFGTFRFHAAQVGPAAAWFSPLFLAAVAGVAIIVAAGVWAAYGLPCGGSGPGERIRRQNGSTGAACASALPREEKFDRG